MNLSLLNHSGFLGECLKWSLHNTSAISAIPSGIPGCPDAAFSTASADKNLIALTNLLVIKVR